MKILALSDQVVPAIYSPQVVELYNDVDLVVGCGDLPYYYLEYVATMLKADVVYVYGNHDRTQFMADGRIVSGAEGCIPIDGRSLMISGILVAGLGGSMRYQPHVPNQYTEDEMRLRILSLMPQLLANRLRYGRYLDVLVTHAPPRGIHDGSDLTHLGFKAFLTLLRYSRPRYHLHGHKHVYRQDRQRETIYRHTTVVNVYPARVIEWD